MKKWIPVCMTLKVRGYCNHIKGGPYESKYGNYSLLDPKDKENPNPLHDGSEGFYIET